VPTFTKGQRWKRWAGPFTDIVDAVRTAIGGIEEWTGEGEACQIHVVDRHISTDVESVDYLASIDARDLSQIEAIRVRIGGWGTRAHVELDVSDSPPAVTLTVAGDDRLRVEGLFAQLEVQLGKSRTALGWVDRGFAVVGAGFLFAVVLVPALLVVGALGFHVSPGFTRAEGVTLGVLAGLILVVASALYYLAPPLELLSDAQLPRTRRFRTLVFGGIAAVALSLIAALLWATLS
jgi:hypothetical protein